MHHLVWHSLLFTASSVFRYLKQSIVIVYFKFQHQLLCHPSPQGPEIGLGTNKLSSATLEGLLVYLENRSAMLLFLPET